MLDLPRQLANLRSVSERSLLANYLAGVPTGIRTPVLTVKGWCPDRARRWGRCAEFGKLGRQAVQARAFLRLDPGGRAEILSG